MKCLIFCGGFGTRMNGGKPGLLKPLTKVGSKEILSHIISIYQQYSIKEFILLGGYRINDLYTFAEKHSNLNIKVLDTGEGTPTGGRLLLAKSLIKSEIFLLTYGDSLTNFNLNKCLNLKAKMNADFMITTFNKKLEYGILESNKNNYLEKIHEKTFGVKINAGFYVLSNRIFDYISSKDESFEIDVIPRLLSKKDIKIGCYNVDFWFPMDTPDDQIRLNNLLLNKPNILFNN